MITHSPQDAIADNWVDRFLPAVFVPYARLARLDRPIGTWLLLTPCLWGSGIALVKTQSLMHIFPDLLIYICLFGLGALVMRGAGCTINDIIDRKIDAKVTRTAGRPLPAGDISLLNAILFLIGQGGIGLAILLYFNPFTIFLASFSLVLVAIYPFMKRITDWPQLFLGLTFNWGALVGFAAVTGTLSLEAVLLYSAGIFWTLGYDTIYAHLDREDDLLIGVKSLAIKLGDMTRPAVALFYMLCLGCIAGAAAYADLGSYFWAGFVVAALHLMRQIVILDIYNAALCLRLFRSNRNFGLLVFLAILLGIL